MKAVAQAQKLNFEKQLTAVRAQQADNAKKGETLRQQEQQLIGAIYALDNVIAASDAYDQALAGQQPPQESAPAEATPAAPEVAEEQKVG